MPLRLRNEIDDSFWFHGSGTEHAGKQHEDPSEVLALARSAQTGLGLSHDELYDLMYRDGLSVVRKYDADNDKIGGVAGYAIADKSDSDKLQLVDFYVRPEDRCRGVGGYLLGKLIRGHFEPLNTEMTIHQAPSVATYKGVTYPLVGNHIKVYSRDGKDNFTQKIEELRRIIASKRQNVLLEVYREDEAGTEKDDTDQLTLFRQGEATELSRTDFMDEGVLFGVINYLNRVKP